MTDEQNAITVEAPALVTMTDEQEAEAVAALVQLLLPYAARLVQQRQRASGGGSYDNGSEVR
jgi:hypothetical protein